MNKYFIFIKTLVLSCLIIQETSAQAPMSVIDNNSAQDLVDMLTGEGVITMNASLNCPSTANGLFEVTGTNNLGIDSGIVLSTGQVNGGAGFNSVIGPNTNSGPGSTTNGINFDADLSTLVSGTLADVCFLEFDFIPSGDSIQFDYIFASSEYWSFSCSIYNDVFGFFISGPGITGTDNIALVPGTDIPVTVNSTTGVGTGALCTAMGPGSPFAQYYNDNTNGPTTSFGGFTDVFTASATVQPCDTYHLKLAIADLHDSGFDSAVFLRAGSLSSIGISTTVTGTEGAFQNDDHCIRGCSSAFIHVNKDSPTEQDLQIDLQFAGNAINGLDYAQLPNHVTIPAGQSTATLEIAPLLANAPTGPREVIIYFMSPYVCQSTNEPMPIDSAKVIIYDSLYAEILTPETPVCQGDEIMITANVDSTLKFKWEPLPLIYSDPTALTITSIPYQTTVYTFTAWMEGAPSTCPETVLKFIQEVDPYGQIILPENMDLCLEDSVSITADVLPRGFNYSLNWEPSNFFRNSYDYENFFWAPVGTHSIQVEATSEKAGCVSTAEMIISVNPKTPIDRVSPTDTVIKYGDQIELSVSSDADIFIWDPIQYLNDPNSNHPIATPEEDIHYRVISLDPFGCRDTAYVNIKVIYESDLSIPNAFSPNGDGLNDEFKIINHQFEKLLNFSIYNRWGQMVFSTTDIDKGWDGTFNNQEASVGVYIYVIEYVLPTKERKIIKGDLTLLK